jgi:protein-tyrosine-phosphatase/DNA-binding transcriptional ArsR family regulator
MSARVSTAAPPPVFGLVGHPLRWRLLRELAVSDRRVRELTSLLGVPQSLASYHLGRLRKAGVIFSRRSTFDGRDAYYALDVARCHALLAEAGAALHPGLRPAGQAVLADVRPARVLFLCTGNSARSQIAEALLRARTGGVIEAFSAGSRPKPLHPYAARVLRDRAIDLGDAQPKHLGIFEGQRFDHVITLCDKVREVCPEFPGASAPIHWSIPDPAAAGPGDDEVAAAFERTALELETRIAFLLHRLAGEPQRQETA